MRRYLARTVLAAALGILVLTGAACGGDDSDPPAEGGEAGLSEEMAAACDEYNRVVNEWSAQYGAQLGEVGAAEAEGEEEFAARQEEAVLAVQELFQAAAEDLRAQAGTAGDEDLSAGLTQAADGMAEIAGRIETYEDVEAAPEMMSSGAFAEGGGQVNDICAG